jgi:hypothetical protein
MLCLMAISLFSYSIILGLSLNERKYKIKVGLKWFRNSVGEPLQTVIKNKVCKHCLRINMYVIELLCRLNYHLAHNYCYSQIFNHKV